MGLIDHYDLNGEVRFNCSGFLKHLPTTFTEEVNFGVVRKFERSVFPLCMSALILNPLLVCGEVVAMGKSTEYNDVVVALPYSFRSVEYPCVLVIQRGRISEILDFYWIKLS